MAVNIGAGARAWAGRASRSPIGCGRGRGPRGGTGSPLELVGGTWPRCRDEVSRHGRARDRAPRDRTSRDGVHRDGASRHGGSHYQRDIHAASARSHRLSLPQAHHMAVTVPSVTTTPIPSAPSQCHGESSRTQHIHDAGWNGAGSEAASSADVYRPPSLSPVAETRAHGLLGTLSPCTHRDPGGAELQVVYRVLL